MKPRPGEVFRAGQALGSFLCIGFLRKKELQSKWVWLRESALEKELGINQDKGKLSVG